MLSFGAGAGLHALRLRYDAPLVHARPAPPARTSPPPAAAVPETRPAAAAPETRPTPTKAKRAPARGHPSRRAGAENAADRIVISLKRRRLWLIDGGDTVLTSPVAVGRDELFAYEGHEYHFATPRGRLRILSKTDDPMWVPPDWHYYEKAATQGLRVVRLQPGDSVPLSDGTAIVAHGNDVGRVNRRGQFWSWTPGLEVVIDGKIFIPPLHSPQRHVPDALGPYKLGLGNGVFIHGTNPYDSTSIGQAVSHGCIRMPNALLRELFARVGVGTRVDIH